MRLRGNTRGILLTPSMSAIARPASLIESGATWIKHKAVIVPGD